MLLEAAAGVEREGCASIRTVGGVLGVFWHAEGVPEQGGIIRFGLQETECGDPDRAREGRDVGVVPWVGVGEALGLSEGSLERD